MKSSTRMNLLFVAIVALLMVLVLQVSSVITRVQAIYYPCRDAGRAASECIEEVFRP